MQVEYRPTKSQTFDEANIFVRLITGKACVREVKLPYLANVVKCPLTADKKKIEFLSLPEQEFAEVVVELRNTSAKDFTFEVVPPMNGISGLTVNPLVKPIMSGKSTLVSIKYNSEFRDFTYQTMENLVKPVIGEPKNTGLAKNGRNKRL